jgi:hypothetical protein
VRYCTLTRSTFTAFHAGPRLTCQVSRGRVYEAEPFGAAAVEGCGRSVEHASRRSFWSPQDFVPFIPAELGIIRLKIEGPGKMAVFGTTWASAVEVLRKTQALLWSIVGFILVLVYFVLLMIVPHPRDHGRGQPRRGSERVARGERRS